MKASDLLTAASRAWSVGPEIRWPLFQGGRIRANIEVQNADERYALGLIDFLAVLDAQRSLYAAQDALVQSEQAIGTTAIALYKAVGGGWRAEDESARP